ncbi:MAG TPA: PrsW family intramembrane metalloprotease [Longimicrobiaceae bacterium]|nr:PrsW family intramembrane metalloprotease [Longimicrobiaceae bacterium]
MTFGSPAPARPAHDPAPASASTGGGPEAHVSDPASAAASVDAESMEARHAAADVTAEVGAEAAGTTAMEERREPKQAIFTLPAVLTGMMAVLIILSDVGAKGFAFGALVAVLPVPFYVALALWLDRYEAEPPRLLARTFVWGATVAVSIGFLVNTYAELVVGGIFGKGTGEFFGAVVSAPVVEEIAKGLVLVILYRGMRDEFDGVVDGVVYAAMVGLGFAMMENVEYYGNALADGTTSSVATFVIRGMMSPFAHPFFTSMIGIGLGVAREGPQDGRRHLPPLLGLCAAIVLHSLWNFVTSRDGWFLGAYLMVMLPAFVGVLVLVRMSLRREAGVVREHLRPLVDEGTLHLHELERLCAVRTRLAATYRAWRRGGVGAWRARREFHQMASELAFHRWRVGRGITRGSAADAERDAEYRRRLHEL